MLGSSGESALVLCAARRRLVPWPLFRCGSTPRTSSKLQVVAAENTRAASPHSSPATTQSVRSIVRNPDTDPHSYEPTASDARAARGLAGRDRRWDRRLRPLGLAAPRREPRLQASRRRRQGCSRPQADGDNPHQWYSPPAVRRGSRCDHGRLRQGRAGEHRVFRRPQLAQLRRARALSTRSRRPALDDPSPLCGRPGRLLRKHPRAARHLPRPPARHALQLRQGGRRRP